MAHSSEIEIAYSLKEKVKLDSVRISPHDVRKPIYRINRTQIPQESDSTFRVFEHGPCLEGIKRDEKIILVVGATGAGKTTFINSLINFVFGVEFEDDFRFKLVTSETAEQNQAESQTQFVNAYTLHHQEGFKLPYTLTIIDTPGFGDSRGVPIKRDYEIAEQLYDFFNSDIDIVDHIDLIAFVCPASLPRLSALQKYVFDAILALFGNDIEENIFIILTFSDASVPKTLAAIKEAKIPHKKYLKFNSSGIFMDDENDHKLTAAVAAVSEKGSKFVPREEGCNEESTSEESDDDEEDFKVFWNLGMKNFKKFGKELRKVPTKSLKLTKEVLKERRLIEVYIRVMKQQVSVGLCKLQQLKQEETLFRKHGDSKNLKAITYNVDTIDEEGSDGEATGDNSFWNFGGFFKAIKEGWTSLRKRIKAIFSGKTVTEEPVIKTVSTNLAETKTRYEEASGVAMSGQDIIEAIKQEFLDIQGQIWFAICEIQRAIIRLREIALKASSISSNEYIDILIQNEERNCKKGWQENVVELEIIRGKSKDLAKIEKGDFDPFHEFYEMMKNDDFFGIGKEGKSPNKDDYQRSKRDFLEKVRMDKDKSCSLQ